VVEVLNISFEEYREREGVNSGFLRNLQRSPAHARCFAEAAHDQSEFQLVGSALHCAVLEPGEYTRRYVEMPKLDRRRKADKQEYERIVGNYPNASFLDAEQAAAVRGMYDAIKNHTLAAELLVGASGSNEVSIFWTREGERCKARLDRLCEWNGRRLIGDIKTTTNASRRAFERSIFNFGYHLQAAWYEKATAAATEKTSGFVFVAVESQPPFGVCVYELDFGLLSLAHEQIEGLFDLYLKCRRENRWPSYPTHLQTVLCPAWMIDGESDDE